MSRIMRKRSHKFSGFTLMEVIIAMVLATMVMGIAMAVVNLVSKSYLGTNMETTVVREDTDFVFMVNDDIKNASTAFTMPRSSFRANNLSPNWDYIGLMDGLKIPKEQSRTGKEIASARALVHATYEGKTEPMAVPVGSMKLKSNDGQGWFIVRILGHDFEDTNGLKHEYELIFEPAKAGENNREIKYKFTCTLKDKDGNVVGDGDNALSTDIATMLTSINSQQIVYRGGPTNPATALAYSKDVLATSTTVPNNSNKVTLVTMILDYSTSMNEPLEGSTTRISSLKSKVKGFIKDLSSKGNVSVLIVPYSSIGMTPRIYSGSKEYLFNLYEQGVLAKAEAFVDTLTPYGATATGDGIRCALRYMNEFNTEAKSNGKEVLNKLVLLTDGETNTVATDGNLAYLTSEKSEPTYAIQIVYGSYYWSSSSIRWNFYSNYTLNSDEKNMVKKDGREYMKHWAVNVKNKYPDIETILIYMSKAVPAADKKALEESFGAEKGFDVNNLPDLDKAFDDIIDNIGSNIEHFQGPSL